MAQISVGAEGYVKEDGGEHAATYEEWLEAVGADVADVGDVLCP